MSRYKYAVNKQQIIKSDLLIGLDYVQGEFSIVERNTLFILEFDEQIFAKMKDSDLQFIVSESFVYDYFEMVSNA